MKLTTGEKAPDFTLLDSKGNTVSLHELRGKKVYVSFFRNTACPFCNLRIIQLTKALPKMQQEGLEVVFFFESSNRIIARSTFCDILPHVNMVGDPNRKVYDQYGVTSSMLKAMKTSFSGKNRADFREAKAKGLTKGSQKNNDMFLIPADFLINEQGVITTAYYGEDINDRIPIEQLEKFVGQKSTIAKAS